MTVNQPGKGLTETYLLRAKDRARERERKSRPQAKRCVDCGMWLNLKARDCYICGAPQNEARGE